MIKIEFSGYVKGAEARKTEKGKPFHTYGVSINTGRTDAAGKKVYRFLNVKDFGNKTRDLGELPANDSYVKITGALDIDVVEKEGKKTTYYSVAPLSLEVSPPKGDAAEPPASADAGKPDLSWLDKQ